MRLALGCPYLQKAFGYSAPVGVLGGLIGLGGGEFRLPVLMYALGFDARSAIPINLATSLITLAFALVARSHTVAPSALWPHLPEIVGLTAGGILSAFHGASVVKRVSDRRLVGLVGALLGALGLLLITEAAFPFQRAGLLPDSGLAHLAAGAAIGTGIGLVSSILGVAGGELLIPTLVFVFAADIKTAGSASALISLGVVASGLWRYWHLGAVPRGHGIRRITAAMGAGSILGATLGALAVAYAPVGFLKLLLGCVLIAAAAKTMLAKHRAGP
jgi:uncharacterized membrane protein YfcA